MIKLLAGLRRKRAWDKNELAYITEAPSLVEPENVTRDTATFNLPFISLGQVGEGKLMVIGNPHYNSICVARTVTAGTGALIKMGSVRSTATRMT